MDYKFQIRERVAVFTSFYKWQTRFWLPDEVLYFGDYSYAQSGYSLILWHGTVHPVPTSDVHKIGE